MVVMLILSFVLMAGSAAAEQAPGDRSTSAEVITSWNSVAHDLAYAEDQFLTFKGQRALAMMHLAMHDALNALVPVFESYAHHGRTSPGHPVAAAAQAAHDVLASQYPNQRSSLAAELARSLAAVPAGPMREGGLDAGRAAAAAILARRSTDGWDTPGSYEFSREPGRYQTTPPWNGFVAQPGFRFATAFALDYPEQFRPPPPPPLATRAYARAFGEVKELGAADSTRRSEDQTAYAIWWMEFAEGSVNRLARRIAADRRMDVWAAARLFAHIAMALYDSYIATWDAKFAFDHWRPYTAIRSADADGNDRTQLDPSWTSLRPAPPFPEYPSAHAAACAASFTVLEDAFGRQKPFSMETSTAPPGTTARSFNSFRAAAAECADSRVQLGFHFRYSTDTGARLGRRVARHVLERTLRPRSR